MLKTKKKQRAKRRPFTGEARTPQLGARELAAGRAAVANYHKKLQLFPRLRVAAMRMKADQRHEQIKQVRIAKIKFKASKPVFEDDAGPRGIVQQAPLNLE